MDTEDVLGHYAEHLRQRRISKAWTQADLAREAGVSLRSISRIESGHSCDLSTFVRILDALSLLDRVNAVLYPQQDPIALAEQEQRGRERQRVRRSDKQEEQDGAFQWGIERD